MAIAPGTRVGRYTVKRLLGRGGFGMVFLAHDADLDRDCALKFLLSEHTANPQILERFFKEARAAARIEHGGIVTVFACGIAQGAGPDVDGMAYIAMELLRGESLADRVRRGPLPIEQAVEIARQTASALGAAHAEHIVHRDLKPDNIFIVPDAIAPTGERVKVLDFGIAKLVDDRDGPVAAAKTSTHLIFGTPRYMSPEQCKSTAKVDERSDIYALGCMLFEMLCGAPPFEGDPGELIAMHQLAPAPRVTAVRADVPPALDDAVAAMLAKKPTDRPASMADVQRLLGGRVSGAVAAPPVVRAPSFVEAPPTLPADSAVAQSGDKPVATTVASEDARPPESLGADVREPDDVPVSRRGKRVVVLGVGTLVVGAGVAAAVLWPDARTTTTVDAPDAAKAPTDEEIRARIKFYDMVVGELVEDADCRGLDDVMSRAAAESPSIAKGMRAVRCQPVLRPLPDKVYAMPATGTVAFGPEDAKVTIVTSADYACPFCQLARPFTSILRKQHPQDVRIVVRSHVVHDWAVAGSIGACAAAHQGEALFERFEDALYARLIRSQKTVVTAFDDANCAGTGGCTALVQLATETGLDVGRFSADLAACAAEAKAAEADWARFGVTAVPAYFVNGRFMSGAKGDELDRLFAEELAKADERIAAGTPRARYYAEWVLGKGAAKGDPYVKVSLRAIDPASNAIVARKPDPTPAWVEVLQFEYNPNKRSSNEAYVQAKLAFASDTVTARSRADDVFIRLVTSSRLGVVARIAMRLRVGEAAVVSGQDGAYGAWQLVRRLAKPPPDPLDSAAILARDPVEHVVVERVVLGWAEAPSRAAASRTRTRAALESQIAELLRRLDAGAKMSVLAQELSEDPQRVPWAVQATDITTRADQLALRLRVGEIGVVRSDDGMHVIRRVE